MNTNLPRYYDTCNHRAKNALLRASFAHTDLTSALTHDFKPAIRFWSASMCYHFVNYLHCTRRPLATKYGYPAIAAAMRK